uniref:NR LBD domain-containing protein n=1 Tax=Macrostomum lignano TaxID=282301 RepID=A0A1I8I9U6_9PLAT
GRRQSATVRLKQMDKKLDKLIELCSGQSHGGRTVGQATQENTPEAEPQDRLMEEQNGIATGQDGDEAACTCNLDDELPAVTINKQRLNIAIQAIMLRSMLRQPPSFVTKELLIELIGRDALTCDSGSYMQGLLK